MKVFIHYLKLTLKKKPLRFNELLYSNKIKQVKISNIYKFGRDSARFILLI